MEKNKIETYLGFCIRARKIIFGTEMISRQKKGVELLVFDGGMGANSLKIIIKAQQTLSCPLLQTEAGVLGAWLHRPSVKAAAITDKHLAEAILTAVKNQAAQGADGLEATQIKFYSGGNN